VKISVAISLLLLFPLTQVFAETDTVQSSKDSVPTPLFDRAIPQNVVPTLLTAKSDRPKPYLDRCHTQQDLEKSKFNCEYGDLTSNTTILLFGDSHALSWFPALEILAKAKKWKLISLTMSSCWPSQIPAWNSTTLKLMTNCATWRRQTIKQIQTLKPNWIFISGTRGFATVDSNNNLLMGDTRTATWEAGMLKTIDQLKTASTRIIYISDTPISDFDVPTCLMANQQSIKACSTPYSRSVSQSWLAEEEHVAQLENITWINPTDWICTTDPCSPLSGKYVIFVDKGHLTATFAATLERPLWKTLTSN
jgi:hypothetical protein